MGVEDDDMSELEHRMRAKLFAEPVHKPPQSDAVSRQLEPKPTQHSRLSEHEQRIARRLLGTANAERIANAREGRRVRVAPVVTTVEYWWVKSRDLWPDTWHLDVIVNRRKEENFSGSNPEDLEQRLEAYRRRNIGCTRIYLTGQQREEPRRMDGKRKSFAERYGGAF